MQIEQFLVLLLLAINSSNAMLFKKLKFPIKNLTTTTVFQEQGNVASRIQCASICTIMPNQSAKLLVIIYVANWTKKRIIIIIIIQCLQLPQLEQHLPDDPC